MVRLENGLAFYAPAEARIEACARLVARWSLTPAEGRLLRLAMLGVPRAALPDCTGTTPNTVKTQVRSLLRKARVTTMDNLVWLAMTDEELWSPSPAS